MSIRIRNPHSVLAALETRPKSVSEILMPPGFESGTGDAWGEVLKQAREHKIRISGQARPPKQPMKSDDGGRVGSAEAIAE
jgi:23S rRNA (guanosine2251-2'-O)-methyltransferase